MRTNEGVECWQNNQKWLPIQMERMYFIVYAFVLLFHLLLLLSRRIHTYTTQYSVYLCTFKYLIVFTYTFSFCQIVVYTVCDGISLKQRNVCPIYCLCYSCIVFKPLQSNHHQFLEQYFSHLRFQTEKNVLFLKFLSHLFCITMKKELSNEILEHTTFQ